MTTPNNERPTICSGCGGKCCQRLAGSTIPADLGDTDETILAELVHRLQSNEWALDWYGRDPVEGGDLERVYYLRPQHKMERGFPVMDSWGGTCVFWSPEGGCRLTFVARPFECRLLEPQPDTRCGGDGQWSKRHTALAWRPYQALVLTALRQIGIDPDTAHY